MMKRLYLLLAASLAVTGIVFGGGGRQQSDASRGTVTLEIFPGFGHVEYIEESPWYLDWLRDNLNLTLKGRILPGDQIRQVYQNMLASHQMTDIVNITNMQDVQDGVNAGLFLDLEQYKEQLPNLYNNPVYKNMIQFNKDTYGKGTALYVINEQTGKSNTLNFQPVIRWDLYEKLGFPKINTMDDLIPLFKKMMELEPLTETGKKTYGAGFFPEWDGNTMAYSRFFSAIWGAGDYLPSIHIETTGPGYTGDIRSVFDDASYTKKMLKWFFDANQAGVLDPDSATQPYSTYDAKVKDGGVFFVLWAWSGNGYNTLEHVTAAEPKGFAQILTSDMKIPIQPDYITGKTDRFIAIGKNTKNPEAAVRFLNYICSWEGQAMLYNLPEGIIWEKGPDGKAVVKDSAWQYLDNDELKVPELNSPVFRAMWIMQDPIAGLGETNPVTGRPMQFGDWDQVIKHGNANNKIFQKWSSYYGGIASYYDLVTKNGVSVKVPTWTQSLPPVPNDIVTISNQIGEVCKTNFYRMVFAANQAEFDSLWKDARDKAEVLGMQKILVWSNDAVAQAKAALAKYK
jgi:ABC-type glycerol-3-phosphate transport system substrate-binding protein